MEEIPSRQVFHAEIDDSTRCLYCVTDGVAIKVGVSFELDARIRTLQTGNPNRIWLLAAIYTNSAQEYERRLLGGLIPDRIHGEWFKASSLPDIIREFAGIVSAALMNKYMATCSGPFDSAEEVISHLRKQS